MPRVRFRSFIKGLFAMGARDANPPGTLRRATGMTSVKTGPFVSRWGSTKLYDAGTPHSLMRFNDVRYYGAGTSFFKDGTPIVDSLSGQRLSFVRMPPQFDKLDYLFVAGGSTLFKVAPDGSTSLWGIVAPPDGFTATPLSASVKIIDEMEDVTGWTLVDCTLTLEGTIKQQGTQSFNQTTAADKIGTITKVATFDLTTFDDGSHSSDLDYIAVWVRVDNPSNVSSLQIQFDTGAGDFSRDYFVANIPLTDIPPSTQISEQTIGISNTPQGTTVQTIVDSGAGEGGTIFTTINVPAAAADTGQTTITTAIGTWVRLRLPKTFFSQTGSGIGGWANIAAIRLVTQTTSSGPATVYWDDLQMFGSAGMIGEYHYRVTWKNSVTGSRSDPTPSTVVVTGVQRQPVQLDNLPTPTDPQVDVIEIWRTLGGGAQLFLDGTVSYTSTTYVDRVSDFLGFNGPEDSSTLQGVALPTDNEPPSSTYNIAFGPLAGTLYWTADSDPTGRGRLYFSAIGRPESLAGFVDVSTVDDPTQTGLVWNGSPYVFSEGFLFQIVGSPPALQAQAVFGAPGTVAPGTVVGTPMGIVYLANDGLRLFDGVFSRLLGFAAVGLVFRGETLENLPPIFNGLPTVGIFHNDEYFLSDGTTTLVVNMRDGTWRDLGLGIAALHSEPDTGSLVAGAAAGTMTGTIFLVEDVGTLVDEVAHPFPGTTGHAIDIEVQTPSQRVDVSLEGVTQRVYIDIDAAGQVVTPTAIYEDAEVTLPVLTGTGRQTYEYALTRAARTVAVRLTASVTARITLYGVEFDVFIPAAETQEGTEA